MKNRIFVGIGIACMAWLPLTAAAKDWSQACIDPANTQPYSTDYGINGVGNILFGAVHFTSGTVTYGGQNGPCFAPTAVTMVRGGTGFFNGSLGSVQDENPAFQNDPFRDEFMPLTFGMPDAPSRRWNKFGLSKNGARTVVGTAGWNLVFTGESGRYFRAETTLDNVRVNQRVDVIGDAARIQWTLINLDTTNIHNLGFWCGHHLAMLSLTPDQNGAGQSHEVIGDRFPKPGFVELPAGRPPITDVRYQKDIDPATFPTYINFLFGQAAPYGLRFDLGPTENTKDANGNSDATEANELLLSNDVFALGGDDAFGDGMIPDTDFRTSTSYLAKYPEIPVGPGQQRVIVQYYRSPWGNGNYAEPYTAVVDAPQLVATDPTGLNELRPNPMTFRVYVDNAQSLANISTGIALSQVRVKLTFPDGRLQLAAGEQETKTIPTVLPREMEFIDFTVETDGDSYGDLPYKVEITSTPGGSKTINGVVKVSSTPRLKVAIDANLVTVPWTVTDSSWETILGLQIPSDMQVFKWDAGQQGYVPSSAAERGFGQWIVSNGDFGTIPLQSNPVVPGDTSTGAPNIQLKAGWNIIGNPYPFAIKLGELVGVSGTSGTLLWDQLVATGLVNPAAVYYDNDQGDYIYVQGGDRELQPNRGYWVYVNTQSDMTISYPPVFARGLPGATRRQPDVWTQTDKQWRLQLAARSEKSQDTQNFVGVMKTVRDVRMNRSLEVPMSPIQNVQLSIEDVFEGRTARLAHAYSDKSGRKSWKVLVKNTEAGTVTLTWPNMTTVPKNIRFRITDLATNTTKDLRMESGYSYSTKDAGTREFRIEAIPGGVTRAVIGNVLVSRPSRAPQAPFTIKYTLSGDAATTVRILSGTGKEVYTVSRGRADKSGENEVQWALRDNANRLVAPGAYRVEILAETTTGERVRKIIPVNVIR